MADRRRNSADAHDWRPIAPDESASLRVIVSASGIVDGELLLRGLNGALVRNATAWILDIKATEPETPGANIR